MPNPVENPIVKEFYALFENAKVLAVTHHKLKVASDVLKSTKIYLDSKKIDYNKDLFEDLIASLRDKNCNVLTDKFGIVFKDVMAGIAYGHKQHAGTIGQR